MLRSREVRLVEMPCGTSAGPGSFAWQPLCEQLEHGLSAQRFWQQASLFHFSLGYIFVFCSLERCWLVVLFNFSSFAHQKLHIYIRISNQRYSSLILSLFTCSSSWRGHRDGHSRWIFYGKAAFQPPTLKVLPLAVFLSLAPSSASGLARRKTCRKSAVRRRIRLWM